VTCTACGMDLSTGATTCPRCGAHVVHGPWGAQGVASSAPPVLTSAPADELAIMTGPKAASETAEPADPESSLHTALVSAGDRQEKLETWVQGLPTDDEEPDTTQAPAPGTASEDVALPLGLDAVTGELKHWVLRLGRTGRLALGSHLLVMVGSLCPWTFARNEGYTPGVETLGMVTLLLSASAVGTLLWRHRRNPKARVAPVLLHIGLVGGLALTLLWAGSNVTQIETHLETRLAFGFYLSSAAAALATIAAVIGLKNAR